MHPILFKLKLPGIGELPIHTYGVMIAIAFLVSYFVIKWEIKRRNGNEKMAEEIVFWALIGGLIGARLFYMFTNFQHMLNDPLGMIFSGSGQAYHGGLIGGGIAIIILLKIKDKSLGSYADIIAPVLFLGQGIGRIGCFFSGDSFGKVTKSFLGVKFPKNSLPYIHQIKEGLIDGSYSSSLPIHPTQLYEMAFNIIMFFVLIKFVRPKLKYKGSTFALFLLIAGTERFFLEFIRVNPEVALGLTVYQFTSLALVLSGAILLKWFTNEEKENFEMNL